MMESVVSRQIFFEAGPALVETTYSSYVRTLPSRTYVSKQKVICTYVRLFVFYDGAGATVPPSFSDSLDRCTKLYSREIIFVGLEVQDNIHH